MGLFRSSLTVLPGGAGRPQHRRDVQQLPALSAPCGPAGGGRHRLTPEKEGRPQGAWASSGAGLIQRPLDIVRVGHGPQRQAQRLALLGRQPGRPGRSPPWAVPESEWIFQINRS